MAYVCDFCRKGTQHGGSHTHGKGVAGGRWKKRAPRTLKLFKPNLHQTQLMVDGEWLKMKLCTKCLRKLKPKYQARVKSETLSAKV
jgi:ribosomal protein L28